MSVPRHQQGVYDLGDVSPESPPGFHPGASRPAGAAAATPPRTRSVVPRELPRWLEPVGDSLGLFVPGTGQLVRGELARGLFFVSSLGFVVALGWAILETLHPLSGTLETLGLSRASGVWTLAGLYVAAMALHLASVGAVAAHGRDPHPLLAGLASLVLPGWGQLLNGDRARALTFLALLWISGATWIVSSAWTRSLVDGLELVYPAAAAALGSPLVRFTLPAVVWSLAVYDAVFSAAARR